ncbi:MAG: cyclic pyranopterin monophosphate synthase MoaC [Candidatus Cloacimonetes bacterium]|nr:cyclic pyranopterin monophosphate synthase MoaC [Candidatus Cloacimonadota bacterium]
MPRSAARTPSGDSTPHELTHLDEAGRPTMVDTGAKAETDRRATATGALRMSQDAFDALQSGRTPKGDPLVVARIAGIQAAKRTADLIPLCHPLPLSHVSVDVEPDAGLPGVRARATVRVHGRTGVEMEALTAVSVALLTAYDMLKAVDRTMRIEDVHVTGKSGGRSGDWSTQNNGETA